MRRRGVFLRALALAAVVSALGGAILEAAVLTVDDDGPADFPSIQSAINAANNGDEIIVKPGRYRETLSFLTKSITVRSEAGPEATVVFLEGETRIVRLDGDSTLRGFTITGGRQRVGGGILVTGSAGPVIEGNIIEKNTAVWNDATGFPGMGAAIAVEPFCEPVITRNVIRDNQVTGDSEGFYAYGGAILVSDEATAVIRSNAIVNNQATQKGGGVYVGIAGAGSRPDVVITNNTIVGNQAGDDVADLYTYGGGISVYVGAEAAIQNNLITDNLTDYSGGGIYFFANNDGGLDYRANNFLDNQPNDCAGLPDSKCNGGQHFLQPLLQDPANGNYRLRSDSELIDLGVAGFQGSLDGDSRPRTVDGDLNLSVLPDIGAFENQGELTRLRFDDADTLSWDGSTNTSMVFDAYRDPLSSLGPGPVGLCWQAGLGSPTVDDTALPGNGDGFAYLVGGRDQSSGSLGFGGSGIQRTPVDACP